MVMYTHQFGPRSGGLSVLVADEKIYPVWQRGGALGDVWVKAEVEIVTNSTFQVSISPEFEATIMMLPVVCNIFLNRETNTEDLLIKS